jgi:predicted dehydrogenase
MLEATAPDIIDIVTPPPTHSEFVSAAVETGASVICQKPFTGSYAGAQSLVDRLGEKVDRVFVHENIRFQPWYARLKTLIDEGAIGAPSQLAFRLRPGDGQGDQAYLDRQPYFRDMPRFLVHETGIHWIDTFRYLFGEVSAVYARLRRGNPVIAGEDAGMILFDFVNGRQGLFDANRLLDHAADNPRLTMGDMLIEGTGGSLSLDGFANIRLRRFGSDTWEEQDYAWCDENFGGDCVYRTNRHIVEHLVQGSPVVNSAADYLVNLHIEEAIYRSADCGRRIELTAEAF